MKVSNQKGMSGISTLIIFIALILVAAVAALVLLQTVSSLQSQALATGKESKEQVSSAIQFKRISGYIPENDYISFFRIVAQLAPGSGKINLDKTYLSYSDGNNFKTGVDYNSTSAGENNETGAMTSAGIIFNGSTLNLSATGFAAGNYYSIRWLGETAGFNDKTDIDPEDSVEIFYKAGHLPINTNFELKIYPPEGTAAVAFVRTPSSFDNNYETLFP